MQLFRTINYRFISRLLIVCAVAVVPAQAAKEQEISDMMLNKSNSIVEQLQLLRDSGNLSRFVTLDIIRKDMSPLINFAELTKKAMGKHWRRTDDNVREEIILNFRALLENTYAKVFAQYSGQQVKPVSSEVLENGDISVVLQISGNNKSANINYIFSEDVAEDYFISGIKVEGISLVANYRRQFATIISREGAPALAKRLRSMAAAKIK